MSAGKSIRLKRLVNSVSGRGIIVPIDHGFTMGPIKGIESSKKISQWIQNSNINAIIAHKGMVERLAKRNALSNLGVIVHLNGMSNLASQPDQKEMLTSVDQALILGADAISIQLNFTGNNESQNWKCLGQLVDQASRFGLPVLTMLYDKYPSSNGKERVFRMRAILRAAMELGTDAIKIGLMESASDMNLVLRDVVEDVCVFVAGGDLTREDEFLANIAQSVSSGATGVCVGRNIFSRMPRTPIINKISNIVHGNIKTLDYNMGFQSEFI